MGKKLTAVEWLQVEIDNKDMGEIPMWIYQFIEQAKEMEKKQIERAFEKGFITTQWDKTKENKAEEYYNETFKNK